MTSPRRAEGAPAPGRPAWVEVDLDAIAHNVRTARQALRPGAQLMAVVKADAYGHGAVPVARAALRAGAAWLGVAVLSEALELRAAGLRAPILILGWTPPELAREAVRHDVALTVFRAEEARELARLARETGRPARVHLKVDTGMGRLGVPPDERGLAAAEALAREPLVLWEGTFTHFACADEEDPAPTRRQIERFSAFLARLEAAGLRPGLRHAANTAGLFRFPDAHFDLVRLGIGLYGYAPSPFVTTPAPLQPALAWKARLAQVKAVAAGEAISYGATYVTSAPEWIGTVPVGYADGYRRAFSNVGRVLVGGVERPVRGRVCMDQFMIGLGPAPAAAAAPAAVAAPPALAAPAAPGDEVVLLGAQGEARLTANDLAQWAGTIAYEILTSLDERLPRVYTGAALEEE
ncbi:MAG: alanine racemase [Firmicutes bacterium]|nr:alanine racemase [Bacillota bacterium]